MEELDWEVLEEGHVVAQFNAQLRADLYARAESKQFPRFHFLIRNRKSPEINGSVIIREGHTYVRRG